MRASVRWTVAVAAVMWGAGGLLAQKAHDPLSNGQVDQIRELGDRPIERVKLLLKFVNDRAAAIKELTPNSTENDHPAQLRARFEEFTRIADELSDNIDTYDTDHADLRKALRMVVESSAKWPEVLKAPAAEGTYDFSRKTALDASLSLAEQAQQLLVSEEAYFAAHKKEVGGNGRAPSPE